MAGENDKHLSYALKEVEKKVDRILGYFYNDDNTGQKGLVQRVADNESAIADLKNKREIDAAVKRGQIAVYATIGSALTLVITWILKLIVPFILKLV
jgi:hypothetical protein